MGKVRTIHGFGDQEVIVTVDVREVSAGHSAVQVNLAPDMPFLQGLNNSMSWGGKGIFDWSPDGGKFMILRDKEPEERHQKDTAMHEFGHSLGLGDAYYKPENNMPGVDYTKYPDAEKTVMDYQYEKRPTNNDIEMVILAFATGKRQNYQQQFPWNKVSAALGKGN